MHLRLVWLALALGACGHPTDPVVVPNEPESTAGTEVPTSTLRAPSDTRTEEVESTTGLPTPQSQ